MLATQAKIETLEIIRVPDWDADTSYLEQDDFEERLDEYRAGSFGFIGIQAKAQIAIPHGSGFILQTITSSGLWGVEDDSDESYLREIASEELDQLKEMLETLNVDCSEFDALKP